MPRSPRIIVPNIPYHVTQRGNHGRDVFYHPNDRKRYLDQLTNYSELYRFDIQAYCLMSNHIHIVGIPRKKNSIAVTMQVVQSMHTKSINYFQKWTGNLWQQHHTSSALDNKHMWNALRYVEQNPVRAGLVIKCEDYPWSSAAFHCGVRDDKVLKPDFNYADMFDNWHEMVNQMLDDEALEYIRLRTYKGFPCGDSKFVDKIARKTGQDFSKKKRGRPRNPYK